MRIDRVLANNPGTFTGPGTNTWVLDDGGGRVVIIDPGPVDDRHATAIMERVAGRQVDAVLVTHTHSDHAPLANPLASDLGVPPVGHAAGPNFEPEIRLLDGARFEVGAIALEVIHTPGHADDHLCFLVEDVLFSGDHIIGGSSVMVDDMGRYLESLEKVKGRGLRRIHPGHGEEIGEPDTVIDWYIAHRMQRHEEVFGAVVEGARTVTDVVDLVYADVDAALHPLAARSVDAHLKLLIDEGRIALLDGRVAVAPEST